MIDLSHFMSGQAYAGMVISATLLSSACLAALMFIDSQSSVVLSRGIVLRSRAPSRMRRMMRRQQVNVRRYLLRSSTDEIRRHAAACRQCTATAKCNQVLAATQSGKLRSEIPFCPNRRMMLRFSVSA